MIKVNDKNYEFNTQLGHWFEINGGFAFMVMDEDFEEALHVINKLDEDIKPLLISWAKFNQE